MDANDNAYDTVLFRYVLNFLTDLAHSRLLGIIRNGQRLAEALSGRVDRAH